MSPNRGYNHLTKGTLFTCADSCYSNLKRTAVESRQNFDYLSSNCNKSGSINIGNIKHDAYICDTTLFQLVRSPADMQ